MSATSMNSPNRRHSADLSFQDWYIECFSATISIISASTMGKNHSRVNLRSLNQSCPVRSRKPWSNPGIPGIEFNRPMTTRPTASQ